MRHGSRFWRISVDVQHASIGVLHRRDGVHGLDPRPVTFRAILAKHAKKSALAYKELLKKVQLNKDRHFMGPTRPLTDCITEAQLTKLAVRWTRSAEPRPHDAVAATPCTHTGTSSTARTLLGRATRARPSTSSLPYRQVTIKDIGKVAELREGDYFGERGVGGRRQAHGDVYGDWERLPRAHARPRRLRGFTRSVEDLVQHGTNEEVELVEQEDRVALDVTLEHLDVQRTDLGHGRFGKVQLVMDRRNGTSYALKYQSKAMIVENSLCDHVLREREMLMKLDHPCIVKLILLLPGSVLYLFSVRNINGWRDLRLSQEAAALF